MNCIRRPLAAIVAAIYGPPQTMKLHLHEFGERNVIKRCQDGMITVNEHTFDRSVIITPGHIIQDWRPQRIDDLTAGDLHRITDLGVELVILGTGSRQVFPPVSILEPLVTASLGYEIMDTRAAARTYNIVASEGRNAAVAILLQ